MPATLLDSAVHIVASDEEEEDLRTLQHQDNLLMLLVLVITPYYLRTLYDYTLERFNALLQWISEHGYGIRCGENRRGHIGLGMLEVLQSRIPWREARTMTGMDKDTTLVAGFARLLLWHHLQPIAYGLAFVASWNDVSPLQRMLGAVVALREAIYLALTLICLHFNPAYLLVDTAATWRKDRYVALIFTLLYVLSPEKYVWFALVRGAAETGDASAVSAADPPYGRLPSEADEGDVVVAQQSAGAAAIEVSSSERPAALSGPAALAGRAGRVELEERSAAGAPMKITLDGARAGTVEFVAVAGRSWFRTIVLTNDSEDAQLFKVLTTAPTRYRVKPASGSLGAGCSVEVHLVLTPQDAVPDDLAQWAKDKFQIKNLAFSDEGASAEDIANAWKEAAPEAVQATRLRCSHHAPTGLAARTMPRQAPVAAPPAAPSPPPRAEPPPAAAAAAAVAGGSPVARAARRRDAGEESARWLARTGAVQLLLPLLRHFSPAWWERWLLPLAFLASLLLLGYVDRLSAWMLSGSLGGTVVLVAMAGGYVRWLGFTPPTRLAASRSLAASWSGPPAARDKLAVDKPSASPRRSKKAW